MRYRFAPTLLAATPLAAALLAAALPLSAVAQQTGLTGDAAKEKAGITGAPALTRKPHHHRAKSAGARDETAVRPDATQGGATGAAAGVVKPPVKADPEVHNLNTILPP